jgi:hypothetical protein
MKPSEEMTVKKSSGAMQQHHLHVVKYRSGDSDQSSFRSETGLVGNASIYHCTLLVSYNNKLEL